MGIEEQFYIFFPLLLWCCAKRHLRPAAVILFLGFLSFCDNLYVREFDTTQVFYSPLTRVWKLLAGAALSAIMRQSSARAAWFRLVAFCGRLIHDAPQENDGRNLSLILAVAGLCILLVSLKFAREDLAWPGWSAALPVTEALAYIAAGPLNPVSRLLLANRFFVFVGLISYPLYLWHWVLLSFAHITGNGLPPDALRLALAATAFALAVLTYLLVERPIRFGQRGRKAKLAALVLSMILLGGTGLAVQQMHGLPDRGDFRRLASMLEQLKLPEIRDVEGLAYTGTGKEQLTEVAPFVRQHPTLL